MRDRTGKMADTTIRAVLTTARTGETSIVFLLAVVTNQNLLLGWARLSARGERTNMGTKYATTDVRLDQPF